MIKPKQRYQCVKALPKINWLQEDRPITDPREWLVDSIVEITCVGKGGARFVDFKVIKGRKPKGNQCIGQYTTNNFLDYYKLMQED